MALEVQMKKTPKGPIKFQIQLNEEQKAVKSAILNNVITIVTGQAGSGKTLVACQAALDSLFTREVERIIVARPVVTAKEDIGFLPGGLKDKLDPYIAPIYDNLYRLYDKAKIDSLEAQKIKFQEDLTKILSDPYKKLKAEREKLKLKLKKRKTKNKAERAKARRDLAKKMALNAAKTLAPIIALQIAGRLASILSQRGKLEVLVDQVNAYIEQANTPETIAIATNLRNNTITLINNSIGKLSSLQKTISQIATYITIFSTIVAILSAIPIPTAVPPGIGIPVNVIIKIVKTLERANKLILALNVVLAISTVVLGNEISKLNDLIERLKTVNQLLDLKSAINLNEQQLADLSNAFLPTGGDFGIYKGFKFAIKEEQTLGAQQAIVVKGNKRRYAVAINRDGTDILRSELSFTLDPNDLIDQLKLIIDQRNLQG